jgi:hypothetical protein
MLFDNLELASVETVEPSRVSENQASQGLTIMAKCTILVPLVQNQGPLARKELSLSNNGTSRREA